MAKDLPVGTFLQDVLGVDEDEQPIKLHDQRPTIIFRMRDKTELHVRIVKDGNSVEVRCSGRYSGSLIIKPHVSNEVEISVEPYS